MRLSLLLLSMGMISLYLGFAAGLGLLFWKARARDSGLLSWASAGAYAMLLLLPASLYIARFRPWPPLLRTLVLLAGMALSLLLAFRLTQIPSKLRSPLFSRQYLSATMLVVASWCLTLWFSEPMPSLLVLGLASSTAALSALRDVPARYERHA